MVLQMNNNETNYIYQQIYKDLQDKILNGKIKPNEKLPSKRRLAKQLNVSVNTVVNAYDQLFAEGYIYKKERKGHFAEKITPFIRLKKPKISKLKEDNNTITNKDENWLSLSLMTPDISKFPFNEWIKHQQTAIKNHKNELSKITDFQGPYLIRENISHMLSVSRGVSCEPEQIIIGAGTQYLIQTLMEIRKNNNVIAFENPGYFRIYTLLKNMGFKIQKLPIDKDGVNIENIKPDVKYLFVTPSHQFPTGIIMPISRRIELLNWSSQGSDRYIIEDDYDSEFKYETDSMPSLQSLDKNSRVIYTGTFSKTIFPGLRISYMVLPPDILEVYLNYHRHNLMPNTDILSLYTLHYFIKSGDYAKHIKRMNLLYEAKRKSLINQIIKVFGDRVRISNIPAGMHFLAEFKSKHSYSEFKNRSLQKKLEVFSLEPFLLDGKHKIPDTIKLIIGFANIKESKIPEIVDRLWHVLN